MANAHVNTASSVPLVTTAETVAVTISPAVAITAPSGEGVAIQGSVNVTAGTGTTAIQVRVRQGTSTSGTLVGQAVTHTLAAGATASVPVDQQDSSASALAGTADQWIVTVQQTGASANGTVNSATITAESCNAVE